MTTPVQKLMALKVGQQLLVETIGGELLVGTLKSINIKYLMVELDNVRDIKTNYTYQSSQILAYTQMKNIKLMLKENNETNYPDGTDTDSIAEQRKSNNSSSIIAMDQLSNTSSSSCKEQTMDSLNIQLTSLDLQLLQTQLDSMLFIIQTDHKYHKALNDMRNQTVIGLLIEPIDMGRNCKTSLMAVSTSENIYLFDMMAIGKIFKEIRLILEADRPRKAVHFSHKIADHLKYRHNVILKGIFDTFLAYCLVTGEKSNISLEETVQKTFSISKVYFDIDVQSEIPPNSYQRPLPHSQRMIIAKKVAFQLKLYNHLLHEYMLRNFYNQCERFSQTFCQNDDNFEVGQQLHPSSRAGYEHIQPNGNWKDKLNFDLEFLNNK